MAHQQRVALVRLRALSAEQPQPRAAQRLLREERAHAVVGRGILPPALAGLGIEKRRAHAQLVQRRRLHALEHAFQLRPRPLPAELPQPEHAVGVQLHAHRRRVLGQKFLRQQKQRARALGALEQRLVGRLIVQKHRQQPQRLLHVHLHGQLPGRRRQARPVIGRAVHQIQHEFPLEP